MASLESSPSGAGSRHAPNGQRHSTYLIFGAPGSGKGTQGRALGTVPGFFHCACGDVFRSIDMSTPLGQAFLDYSSRGQLVPDELTIALWLERIEENAKARIFQPGNDHLILDGIPRNLRQAKLMDDLIEVKKVFHLHCGKREKLVDRLRKRALKDNRLDDASDAIIQRRLEVYEEESAPLLSHYGREKVVAVDATEPPVVVLKHILADIVEEDRNLSIAG